MLARRVSMAGLTPSNTSGALIRAVSYLSLRVGHPARSGAEDAAGALRRRHELARHGHRHGDDRVEADAVHGHAAVAEHAQPIVGQGRTQEVAAHLLPTRPVVGPQPTRWRAGRSPGCAPGVAPGHRPRGRADPRVGAPVPRPASIRLYHVMLDTVQGARSPRSPNLSTQPRGNRAQPRARARAFRRALATWGSASTKARPGARLPQPRLPSLAPRCWEKCWKHSRRPALARSWGASDKGVLSANPWATRASAPTQWDSGPRDARLPSQAASHRCGRSWDFEADHVRVGMW